MKIVFCGPPHSGKTVLIDNLRKIMPSDGVFIDRIHLDGEGIWSNYPNQDMAQTVRNKQSYDIHFIRQKCEELSRYDDIPIVLVDIGGKLAEDKHQIFEAADAFVVISADHEMGLLWQSVGTEHNCHCLAVLDSSLHGTDQIYGYEPYLTGCVTNLERGKTMPTQEIVTALADIIIKEAGYKARYRNAYNEIDFNRIAVELGMTNDRTTRYGQVIHTNVFDSLNAIQIYKYLQDRYASVDKYLIYGARANWLSAMTACMFYSDNKQMHVYDTITMKYIPVRHLPKSDITESKALRYKVIESDNAVFIDILLDKPVYSDTDDYQQCVIPVINEDKPLYVSGRLPLWLLDAIMISYNSPVKYVFQPGRHAPWICCFAQDISSIGTSLSTHPSEDVCRYFEQMREEKMRK
ncbi:MAG: hypothetical protein IKP67_00235 [Spirochaetales bacterium]|nr:hypothetical protein [Spirochaetales bacterium]